MECGQEMAEKKRPTLKMRTALLDYVLNPTVPIIQIAERNNVKYDALRKAIQRNQDFIQEESMKVWRSKVTMCQRVMEQKAERGDFKSLDFILRSCGIVPGEKVITDTNDIHITLEQKEK